MVSPRARKSSCAKPQMVLPPLGMGGAAVDVIKRAKEAVKVACTNGQPQGSFGTKVKLGYLRINTIRERLDT